MTKEGQEGKSAPSRSAPKCAGDRASRTVKTEHSTHLQLIEHGRAGLHLCFLPVGVCLCERDCFWIPCCPDRALEIHRNVFTQIVLDTLLMDFNGH